jgi:hypothetical protein
VAEFVRDRRYKTQRIFQLRTANCDNGPSVAFGNSFLHGMKVKPGGLFSRAAAPVRQKLAEFIRLVGKDFKLKAVTVNVHVVADTAEELFHGACGRPVVRIREIFRSGSDDSCVEHLTSSEQFLQAAKTLVDPLPLIVADWQFRRETEH